MLYYGKYRAKVVDIKDPEERGRIKVECPRVLGASKSSWCLPCVPVAGDNYGDFCLPLVGETVWVEFEEGNISKPIYTGNWYSKFSTPLTDYSQAATSRIIGFKNTKVTLTESSLTILAGGTEFVFDENTDFSGSSIVSAAFSGDDLVFTKDDETTITLTDAKITLKGETGLTGASGADGTDGASIVSAEFSGDNIVFTKDDDATVTLADAKIALKGDQGDVGPNAIVKGIATGTSPNFTLTASDFQLAEGTVLLVKFGYVGFADMSNVTLNVNSTGAKEVFGGYNKQIIADEGAYTLLMVMNLGDESEPYFVYHSLLDYNNPRGCKETYSIPNEYNDISSGYQVGDLLFLVSTTTLYVCRSNDASNAVWEAVNTSLVNLYNIVPNEFEDTTGWKYTYASLSVASGQLLVTATGGDSYATTYYNTWSSLTNGHIFYGYLECSVNNSSCTSIELKLETTFGSSLGTLATIESPVSGQVYAISGTFTAGGQSGYLRLRIVHNYADSATATGKVLTVKNAVAMDLTNFFYEDREPTKEQIDALMESLPDKAISSYSIGITSQDLMHWTVEMIKNSVYTHPATHSADMIVDGETNKAYTADEKTKLSGIATSANNYVHPTTAGNKHIPSGGAASQILRYSANGTAVWSDEQSISGKLNLTGGTMTGKLTAQNNTSYTTKQVRNITLSTANPSGGSNGDVWIKYTA